MNKVKCVNGHFFNLDKFSCCPICNGGVAGLSDSRKPKPAVEQIHKSRLDNVDKTARLVETDTPDAAPATGKAGGIKWRFGQRTPDAPEKEAERPKPEQEQEQAAPQAGETAEEPPQPELPECGTADQAEPAAPPAEGGQKEPEGSALTRAVAATGHGAFSALPKTVAYYDDFSETEPPTGWLVCVKGVYQGQAFGCKAGRNRIGRNANFDISLMNDVSITREPHAILIYEPKQRVFYLQNGTGDGLVYLNGSLLFSHEQLHAYDKVQIGNAEFVFLPLCGEQFTWDDYIR